MLSMGQVSGSNEPLNPLSLPQMLLLGFLTKTPEKKSLGFFYTFNS